MDRKTFGRWAAWLCAVLIAAEAGAGTAVALYCTHCRKHVGSKAAPGAEEVAPPRFTVGSGRMPGRRFALLYCETCRTFESGDVLSRKDIEQLIADYDTRLAATNVPADERSRTQALRKALQESLVGRKENPLACPGCGKDRREVPVGSGPRDTEGVPLDEPCPTCGTSNLVVRSTGMQWD